MKLNTVVLLLSCFIISCHTTKINYCKKDYVKNICKFTRDGRYIHITINIKGKGKLLLESKDLYPDYINVDITTDSTALYNILTKKYWQPKKPLGLLEKRFIDIEMYHKVSKIKPIDVYNIYFDKNGYAKDGKFTEQEIEAAVAYLLDCNVFITAGQDFLYRVNHPPTRECNKYNKKWSGM